ncbi:DUF2791 family P-loop domain-containing protein [bacterium]|nr:DUF2791 family P-loop domain-containing protein [bacterium]
MKADVFVPSIIRRYDREKPWFEWLSGAVLFADISGFTFLSEKLSILGAEGAEIMSSLLNRYFSRMISIVRSEGGEVMKFAGDSIFCLFANEGCLHHAKLAAARMQKAMVAFGNLKTPVGNFGLAMKMGLAEGDVMIGAVGDPNIRCEFLFAGDAVDRASRAEQRAGPGEVIVDQSSRSSSRDETSINTDPKNFHPFLIKEVSEQIQRGYEKYVGALRRMVPVFLQFEGFTYQKEHFTGNQFHNFFCLIIETAHRYGGRLNAVTTGDKGSNFLLHFGAPNPLEKKQDLAAQFALDIREAIERRWKRIQIKIGMTEGRVFAGIVGGAGSFYYTVVGDPVNLAARLMQIAVPSQILVSESFQKRSELFEFSAGEEKRIKGKTDPVLVFALQSPKKEKLFQLSEQNIAGRTAEIQTLLDHLEEAEKGKPRIVFIEGESGIGKSYLAGHICSLAHQKGWLVAAGKSEITRRSHAYAAWKNLAISCLFGGKTPDLRGLRKILKEAPEDLSGFLPMHAEFFELDGVKSSSGYDENTKKNLLHHQISTLLLQRANAVSSLFFLDDLHWFDSLSLELLSAFLNHLNNEPLILFAAGRPNWNKDQFLNRKQCYFLTLEHLKREEFKQLMEVLLSGKLRDPLFQYFYQKTQGNPFLLTQLLDYMKNQNALIQIGGKWTASRESLSRESLSGEEIISARADQLDLPEKIHLQTAACMGPTFSLRVLEKALCPVFQKPAYDALCEQGYFQQVSHDQVTFSHALIQEAIYHSLPERFRRKTHREIGCAMESVLSGQTQKYSPNLANHFRLAGMTKKSVIYSLQAADQLYRTFSFPESRRYYSYAYDSLKHTADSRKWDTALKLAENMMHTGEIQESIRLSKRIRNLARRAGLRSHYARASLLQFDAMRRISNYSYLPFSLRLTHSSNQRKDGFRSKLHHLIGSTYFWLGNLEKAEFHLRKALQQAGSKYSEERLSCYFFLFTIAADRKQLDQAERLMRTALTAAVKSGNLFQEIRIRQEWAGILSDNDRPEKAREILLRLLPRAESFGDFYMVAIILVGLGEALTKLANYEEAEKYLQEAIRLFSVLGVTHGVAKSKMWLGIVHFYQEEFRKAYDYYREATSMFVEAGEMQEAAMGFYNLAEVCLKLANIPESRKWYRKGMKSLQKNENAELSEMFQELKNQLRYSEALPLSNSMR